MDTVCPGLSAYGPKLVSPLETGRACGHCNRGVRIYFSQVALFEPLPGTRSQKYGANFGH